MRTRNTVLRDLVADEAQLARHGPPLWRTEDDVAEAGNHTQAIAVLRHPSRDRPAFTLREVYDSQAIRKSAGHSRRPRARLKQLQRRVLDLLVRKLPVSEHYPRVPSGTFDCHERRPACGSRGHSFAGPEGLFSLGDFGRIRGLLVALGYGYRVATTLAVLTTEAERQPTTIKEKTYLVATGQRYCVQGGAARTSPGLCNAIALRLDRRLVSGLASETRVLLHPIR